MQKFTPMLWFDTQAEEAARFYVSIFDDSKLGTITHYGAAGAEASGRPKGSVMTVEFEIEGQKFVGLNGGPQFKFSEAISFVVNCKNQKEIDTLWAKLTAGGGAPSVSYATPMLCRVVLSWRRSPNSRSVVSDS